MLNSKVRTAVIVMAAALGLGGCASYDRGYGYGGFDVGYASNGYYGGGLGYGSGWYNDFYYPGSGFLVYDRGGRSYRWNNAQQRYWEGRRFNPRDREDVRDIRRYRRDANGDRRDFVQERRDDRRAVRNGEVTREAFRADRQVDRQSYRTERRSDSRALRRDLRDRPRRNR